MVTNYHLGTPANTFKKFDPTFRTPKEITKSDRKDRLARKGKTPPKKGMGKRAMKLKKTASKPARAKA